MSNNISENLIREAAKKVIFLVARPLRGGGPLRKKNLFSNARKKVPMATKNFFAASLGFTFENLYSRTKSHHMPGFVVEEGKIDNK